MNSRLAAMIGILALLVLGMIVCGRLVALPLVRPGAAYQTITAVPLPESNPEAAYFDAQSTLTAGQSMISELSSQATAVNSNIDQAADAVAQTTLAYHQRQLMELAIQRTEISLNMFWAAATQQFITQQTQMVREATASAQNQAATATYVAYLVNVTQTALAQESLNVQSTRISEINATVAAYSLTATPWAAMQASIVRTRQQAERRALWDEFVITPIKTILAVGVALLLIAGGVIAYQRLMPVLEWRLRTLWGENGVPLLLVDGKSIDTAPSHHLFTGPAYRPLEQPPQLSFKQTPPVEVVDSAEPAVINWIIEAEQKLHSEGGLHQ